MGEEMGERTGEQMDTRQLIVDTAEKIFADHCDKGLLDAAERGEFARALWSLIDENGFTKLGTPESGTDAADMYAFIKECGRYAVPVPIAETLVANQWCPGTDGVCSIGVLCDDVIGDVPWGEQASKILGVTRGDHSVLVADSTEVLEQRRNLAGEMRVDVRVRGETIEIADDPYTQLALTRVNLMAGGLNTVLELGIQFATERVQFGRAISKFQAIQHSLAVVASEVAAAQRAADAAVDALGTDRFIVETAASKARVGEACGIVAEQVHQIHGAMGFTHEHRLHHFTRRLWAWRDDWGNEFYWQGVLGSALAQHGADQAWDFIATRG
jgi:alkylation response protein AidB-like acyl-CoA dehydrogenase